MLLLCQPRAGRLGLQRQEFKVVLDYRQRFQINLDYRRPYLKTQTQGNKLVPLWLSLIPEGLGSCPTHRQTDHRTQADRSRTRLPLEGLKERSRLDREASAMGWKCE